MKNILGLVVLSLFAISASAADLMASSAAPTVTQNIVVEGAACPGVGATGFSSTGLLLSCQSGSTFAGLLWKKAQGFPRGEAEIYGLPSDEWPDSFSCFSGGSGVLANIYSFRAGTTSVTYLIGSSHQVYVNSVTGVITSGGYGDCSVGVTIRSLISAERTTH